MQIQCRSRALPHYYSGCGAPGAHSKGALAFRRNLSGFHLQATTPNYPDPSLKANEGEPVRLGCQLNDETALAQSFLGLTLSANDGLGGGNAFNGALAPTLKAAWLCSTGSASCVNGTAGHVHDWSCTSEHTRGLEWSILNEAFAFDRSPVHTIATQISTVTPQAIAAALALDEVSEANEALGRSAPTAPTTPKSSTMPASPTAAQLTATAATPGTTLTLLAKNSNDAVAPWLLVAHALSSDLAVATWLDSRYGSPTICKGDNYADASEEFCLTDAATGLTLRPDGGAAFSVENALVAEVAVSAGRRFAWGLWGDLYSSDSSHAKYGVGSTSTHVISGDMNQQGFPCSKNCKGSQNGRGGTFFAIEQV